jgi:chondroitin AC lyase
MRVSDPTREAVFEVGKEIKVTKTAQ